jgi:HlyD family secretion protein
MKKKSILAILVLVVIVAAILGFTLIKKGKAEQPKYRTDKVTKGDIEALVVTSGTINPIDIVEIGSQVSGKINKLYADFNSPVKAGQIVAELDQDIQKSKVEQNTSNFESAAARLEQAKVTLENAKKQNDRTQELFQKNLVSLEAKETAEASFLAARVGVQTAQATVSQAQSSLNQSRVDLSYCIIRSPIDGMVITRNVNVGQTVAASMSAPVLFKVASDLTKMQVQCDVDEADIGKVKEGQKVRFSVDAFQGEIFQGVIRQVRNSPTTAQNVVTYQTIINASNPDLKLRPGMTATVSIITGEARGVLKIPNTALRFTPALPPEELQKLLAELRPGAGQRGQTGAQGESSQTQTQTQTPSGEQAGGQRQGGQRFDMSTLTPEQLQRFQQMRQQGGARRQGGTVWIQDELGAIKPMLVRTGVTDNTFSEVVGGQLKEGMIIIIGAASAAGTTAATQQGQRGVPGGMMFMGR